MSNYLSLEQLDQPLKKRRLAPSENVGDDDNSPPLNMALDADTDLADNKDDNLQVDDCWPIFDSYFSNVGFVRHHIESYDSFFEYRAQRVISEQPEVEVTLEPPEADAATQQTQQAAFVPTTYVIQYKQLHVRPPMTKEADGSETVLLPAEARLRSQTYAASLYVDLTLLKISNRGTPLEQVERHDAPQVFFGTVPVMVRSRSCHLAPMSTAERIRAGECEYDEGGYFIINGLEKVFVAQEKLPDNEIYVYAKNKVSPYSHVAQVRSLGEHSGRSSASATTIGLQRSNGKLQLQMPQVRQPVPLYVVFCALGITERADVEKFLLCGGAGNGGGGGCGNGDDAVDEAVLRLLKPTLLESHMMRQRDVALDYIGKRTTIVAPTTEKRIETARQILGRELLPHLGNADVLLEKACFLGRMVHKLLRCVLRRIPIDDRDSFGAKRVELAGPLLESLFKQIMRQMSEEIRKSVVSSVSKGRPVLFAVAVKPNILSNKMRYSFATGNWGMQRGGAGMRTGVTQPLSRQSFSSMLSHLRRVDQQLAREGKVAQPRLLHATQWGIMCAAETPEGQACGLVKNFTVIAGVTPQANNTAGLVELLAEYGVRPLVDCVVEPDQNGVERRRTVVSLENCKVVLDGRWLGTTAEPQRLATFLRHCRRTQRVVTQQTSIVYIAEEQELRISSDAGRVTRPLYVVDARTRRLALTRRRLAAMLEQSPQTLWQDLLANGFVEYLDVQEQRNAQIAMFVTDVVARGDEIAYTHCELHPATILGVCASMIPFPDHNQPPRNMFQSAMGKQAMSMPSTNCLERLDTSTHMLYYPQQPLVQTRFSRNAHFDKLPSGEVAIVAILCQPGENEEDSTVFNQSAIDRGLFRSTFYRTYQDRERVDVYQTRKQSGGTSESATTLQDDSTEDTDGGECLERKMPPLRKYEEFCKPSDDECVNAHNRNYDHLDDDGLALPGTFVRSRDVIVGKMAPMPVGRASSAAAATAAANNAGSSTVPASAPSRRDCSTLLRQNEDSRIDCVMLSDGPDGARLAKVRTRSTRIPQVGDKFSSLHGQKGTMGATKRQEDMPWTASGIVPDIIINPHAFPSRMTIGQLVETLMGKAAALTGQIGDGTPFSQLTVEQIGDVLHSLGMQRHGGEVMYSGTTGRQLDSLVFIGPTYYQRLKHLAADKIHGRAHGPKTALTRQPVEGRGRDGGLRFGEMERDCAAAYGASEFTLDRLQYCSDNYQAPVCSRCGLIAIDDIQTGERTCTRCNRHDTVELVDMPYANKLLIHELMSMSIVPRMVFKK